LVRAVAAVAAAAAAEELEFDHQDSIMFIV
jgi:hypothetical protein